MNRKLIVLAGLLASAAPVTPRADAAGLAPAPIFSDSVEVDNAGPVSVGDVDGDGTPDLVAPYGTFDGAVAVFLGVGDGTFGPARVYHTGFSVGAVGIVDPNDDGVADLAVANYHDNMVQVLPGPLPEPRSPNVPEDVAGTVAYPTGGSPIALAVGDLDHSGIEDLVVANANGGTVSVLLADHQEGFAPKVDYDSGPILTFNSLALADVAQEPMSRNILDIVVANYASNTISVLVGQPDGSFQNRIIASTAVFQPTAIAVGDLDGNTVLDLVVGQYGQGVVILLGQGDGTFEAQPSDLLPNEARETDVESVAIADLNFDGKAEVVMGTAQGAGNPDPGRVGVLVGRGDGTFVSMVNYSVLPGSGVVAIAVDDLNVDGRPDLAVTQDHLRTMLNRMGPITGLGASVVVIPVDPDTGTTPVTVTFNDVSAAGVTTIELFEEIDPVQFFLNTTAQYQFAEACFRYATPPAPMIARYDAFASVWTTPPQHDNGSAVCLDVTYVLQSHDPWAFVYTSGAVTPIGANVTVNPLDPTTGTTPVTITFAAIATEGETTVTTSTAGPAVPAQFRLGSVYYEIATSAVFDTAEVCFSYGGPPRPLILHWVDGLAQVEPFTRDTGTQVCAEVTSFSPFALVVPATVDDTVAPTIACDAADTAWHATNVSIACTASDDSSGLADTDDAAFSLTTSVAAGTEDSDASTGTRQVCDVSGKCSTAGPVGGNRIDRRAPSLVLPLSLTTNATSPTGAIATFVASASDGADPNPGVTCNPASGSTFSIGVTTVTCHATDHVGNTANGSFNLTVLGANEQLSRLIQDVISASKLPAAVKAQLLANLQPLIENFDPNNPAHRKAACSTLRAFTTVLRLLSGHGLPPAQAAAWNADANQIRAAIGC